MLVVIEPEQGVGGRPGVAETGENGAGPLGQDVGRLVESRATYRLGARRRGDLKDEGGQDAEQAGPGDGPPQTAFDGGAGDHLR